MVTVKLKTHTNCSEVSRSVFAYRLDLPSSEEVSDAGVPGVPGSVELRWGVDGATDIDRFVGDGPGCSTLASLLCYSDYIQDQAYAASEETTHHSSRCSIYGLQIGPL